MQNAGFIFFVGEGLAPPIIFWENLKFRMKNSELSI